MTVKINHAKVSGKPQGTDATRVYGNHWDADHTVTGAAALDGGNALTGDQSIAGAVTITPTAASVSKAINVTQSGPATGPGTSNIDYNLITIADPAATGAAIDFTNGLRILMNTGSSNAFGSKAALQTVLNQATSSTTTGDHISTYALAQASAPNGGTDTAAGAVGSIFSGSFVANLISGATNYFCVSGAEIDVGINGTATAKHRLGWSIVGTGTVYPSTLDVALEIAAAPLPWKLGIGFSDLHGSNPVSTGGTLIGSYNINGTPFTVDKGIDFSSVTFTTYFLKSAGFTVDGSGATVAKMLTLNAAVGTGLVVSDGTVSGFQVPSTDFTHSFEVGTSTNHNYVTKTNNIIANYTDTSQAFNLGLAGVSRSVQNFNGFTSGVLKLTVPDIAGTPTVTFGTGSGTPAVTASNDTNVTLTLSTTTGNIAAGWTGTLSAARGGTGLSSLGTGVATALALNVGSAGAPVTFNGAGGTPSSIVLTNATGTAAGLTAGNVTTNANLTGHVTSAGNATTLITTQPTVHTWLLAQTFTVAPVFTDQSGSRTALGLGTAATQNAGTSGANVPLLNGANTWSGSNTYSTNTHYQVTGTGAGFWLDSVTTGADRWFFGSDAASPDVFRIFSVLAGANILQYAANATASNGLMTVAGAVAFSGGISSSNASAGIGYATGAGGTVTQATSKSTGVTLNKVSGQITMNNAALAAATIVSFGLTNTAIGANDVLIINHVSGGTPGSYTFNAQCAAGSATINVRNNTAGSLSEAIVLQYALIKGSVS